MWPRAEPIRTARLVLEPVGVTHATEMVEVLADPALRTWTGGRPPNRRELEARYARQSSGVSPTGDAGWLNWVLRVERTGRAAGFVQATVTSGDDGMAAEVAWVVAVEQQGRGLATEAALAMVAWLTRHDVVDLVAHVHPENLASVAVARRLGLSPTATVVDDEVRWVRRTTAP